MIFGRTHTYLLGALSAAALGLSFVSAAHAETAPVVTAEPTSQMVLSLSDRINSEVKIYIDAATGIYKDTTATDEQAKIDGIVSLAKSTVKEVPESVPSLLAVTKTNLPTNYYESVRVAVTEMVAPTAALQELERVHSTDQVAQGVATTGGKSGSQDWLNYKMKVDVGGRTQVVVWSPTQWKNQWWPNHVTQASQKAWKVAVFNNKYLTVKPLSSVQTASLWGSWADVEQMDKWIPGLAHNASGDAMNKTVQAFLNPRYLKLLEKVRSGGTEFTSVNLPQQQVPRDNPNVIDNVAIDAVDNVDTTPLVTTPPVL